MSANKIYEYFSSQRVINFKPQDIVLHAGDEITHLLFIESGYIEQRSTTLEGEEFSFVVYEKGAVIPLTTYMETKSCHHDFFALTETVIRKAPAEEVLEFVMSEKDVLNHFFKNFARATTQGMLRMESLVFGGAREKVAAVLYLMASRFGEKSQNSDEIHIIFPLTHRQIGMMAGLSRETVSAEMMKLKKEDIIYYSSGKVSILDLDKLLDSSALSHYR